MSLPTESGRGSDVQPKRIIEGGGLRYALKVNRDIVFQKRLKGTE